MQHVVKLRQLKMIEPVDYEAWLTYTASLVGTPGGAALWPVAKSVITPTVTEVVEAHLIDFPNHPSFIDINPLFNASPKSRSGA